MGPGKLLRAAAYVFGADHRMAPKDAPRPKPIVFDHTQSLHDVHYWSVTKDWPVEGGVRRQAPKVKMVLRIITQAIAQRERLDSMRIASLIRAFG